MWKKPKCLGHCTAKLSRYVLILIMRYLTAGESHGPSLTTILEGFPSQVPLSVEDVNPWLEKRQQGYGRGRRMSIKKTEKSKIGDAAAINIFKYFVKE